MTNFNDDHGIMEVFADHLEMSLKTHHPIQAFEAAQHSTRAYLNSYNFVVAGTQENGAPHYVKMPKR